MPGETRKDLREIWNRLLRKCTFSASQEKSVNDGIKTTIEKEPGMFFGITTDLCNRRNINVAYKSRYCNRHN